MPNKFPALQIEGDLDKRAEGIYDTMRGVGAHEVLIESPQHLTQLRRSFERARREHLLGDPRPVHRPQQGSALQVHPRVQEQGRGSGRFARAFAHTAHRDSDHPEARDRGARRRPVSLQAQGALHLLRHHQAGDRGEEAHHLHERLLHRDRAVRGAVSLRNVDHADQARLRVRENGSPNGFRSSPI